MSNNTSSDFIYFPVGLTKPFATTVCCTQRLLPHSLHCTHNSA